MTRKAHDNTGPALTKEQLQVQRALVDIEAGLVMAAVRLGNFIPKRPEAALGLGMYEWLTDTRRTMARVRAAKRLVGL